jgi:hypothetical protein
MGAYSRSGYPQHLSKCTSHRIDPPTRAGHCHQERNKMSDIEKEFLSEIETAIRNKRRYQIRYKLVQISLMTIIASCGFLTAAASQDGEKVGWLSSSTFLLLIGLLSAACAILNQIVNPGERHSYHRNVRKALEQIRGEVKYRGMPVSEAERLRAIASANPDVITGKLEHIPKLESKSR